MGTEYKKENENKKKYLNQYLKSKKKSELILEKIEVLRSTQISVSMGDGMPKGNVKSDLSGYMAKLDDLLHELDTEREMEILVYKEIEKAINAVQDVGEQEILTRRYILGQSWEKIAVEIGYSYRHTTKKHGQALKNFRIL